MSETHAQRYHDFHAPKKDGIEYMLSVGRRQPMHVGHLETIKSIMGSGYKPIIAIGSTNGAVKNNGFSDPLFNPVDNPLTAQQQREQIRKALVGKVEGKDYFIVDFPDIGDNDRWCKRLVETLQGEIEIDGKYPNLLKKTAFHFLGKEEDKRPRIFETEMGGKKEEFGFFWEGIFDKLGLPVLEEAPGANTDLTLSARQLRAVSLDNPRAEIHKQFAGHNYIANLAREARRNNPDSKLLVDLPITTLDLSLDRLRKEKNISTAQIFESAKKKDGGLTPDNIAQAAKEANQQSVVQTVKLKIASASCNQTAYDFGTNAPNIMHAIDKAVEDGADILSLEELGLVGYSADDYHMWNKDNSEIWKHIKKLADYAAKKNPNLIISLGTLWHYADKELSASDPEYNINNRPYNCQFTITGGKVVAVSAKSILADGQAEYEPHQFRHWPFEKGTVTITLPDGSKVPFGKPVVAFGKDGKVITHTNEQCAEAWNGVGDDLSVNIREMSQSRHLAKLSKTTDISVATNPSASKPEPYINKEKIRADGLCKTGSQYCGAYLYTNFLGSNSGIMAAEGSQIYAQNGQIIHHGPRYSFKNVSYSSAVVEVPVAKRGIDKLPQFEHRFTDHDVKFVGQESEFEKVAPEHLDIEEGTRTRLLWQRDYLSKQPWACQGVVVSLSGGKDSAAVVCDASEMIDLEVKENGLGGLFKRFKDLSYEKEVKAAYQAALAARKPEAEALEEAVELFKKNYITCIYMPSDNSSDRTQNAARFLIEGGEIPDPTPDDPNRTRKVKGIGGSFYVAPIQDIIDQYIIAYSGIDINKLAKKNLASIIDGLEDKADFDLLLKKIKLRDELTEQSPKAEEIRRQGDMAERRLLDIVKGEITHTIKKYVDAEKGTNPQLPKYIAEACILPIPTWSNPKDDATMQNIQARARVTIPWTVANKQGKMALVSSNKSEAVLGYTTFAGDMHMGGINPIGGESKENITRNLTYRQEHGTAGLKRIESLYFINKEKPTAELRKEQDGQKSQTDEDDLGFSYAQSDVMENTIITSRTSPLKAFHLFKSQDASVRHVDRLKCESPELRNILLSFTKRWEAAQFKRIAGAVSPFEGDNVDPHGSVRTPPIGDHFKTAMAHVTLEVMMEQMGREAAAKLVNSGTPVREEDYVMLGEKEWKKRTGRTLEDEKYAASVNNDYKRFLLRSNIEDLVHINNVKSISQIAVDETVKALLDSSPNVIVGR